MKNKTAYALMVEYGEESGKIIGVFTTKVLLDKFLKENFNLTFEYSLYVKEMELDKRIK